MSKPKSKGLRMADGEELMNRFAKRQPLRFSDGGALDRAGMLARNPGVAQNYAASPSAATAAPTAPVAAPSLRTGANSFGDAASTYSPQSAVQQDMAKNPWATPGRSTGQPGAQNDAAAGGVIARHTPQQYTLDGNANDPMSMRTVREGGDSLRGGIASRAQSASNLISSFQPMAMPTIQLRDGGEIHAADGFFGNLRKAVMPTDAEKAAKQQYLADTAQYRPAPAAPAAPAQSAISSYAGNTALAGRMAAAGLRNGGELRMSVGGDYKDGHGGQVQGNPRAGDVKKALYTGGEFVVSNAMLNAEPSLREHLRDLRTEVLADKGMTPEQADAKAANGGTLRAETGKTPGLFPYDRKDTDIYAGLGKPSSAPENTMPPGGLFGGGKMPVQPQGAWDEQTQSTTGQGLPGDATQRAGGATGSWGAQPGGAGGQPAVAGVQGGVLRGLVDQAFPITSTILRGRGQDAADAAAQGNWAGALGHGVRGGLEGAGALGADIITPLARGFDALEPVGRGMVNATYTAATGDSAPIMGAPTASGRQANPATSPVAPKNFDAANAAKIAAANAAVKAATGTEGGPPPKLGDLRNVDAEAGTQDVFTRGAWTTVSTPEAKAARGLRDQAYDTQLATDATNSRADTARQLAYFEKQNGAGGNKYAGMPHKTAAALRIADAQAASAMATTQANNEVSLRNNETTNATARAGHNMTRNANLARLDYDMRKDRRDFETGRDDKSFEKSQASEKSWTEHANTMFQTKDDKGNSVPDTAKAAAYTQFVDQGIALMIPRLEKGGPEERAYAVRLKKEGRAALDAEDKGELPVLFGRQQVHAQTTGSGPFSSGGASSMDPQDFRITGKDNGVFQERVKTQGGQTIPETNLRYGANANRLFWNSGQGSTNLLPNKLRGE